MLDALPHLGVPEPVAAHAPERTDTWRKPVPLTLDQALERARALAPSYGLSEVQLPSGAIYASILNGVEVCQAFIETYPELAAPSPWVGLVTTTVVEP